MEKTVWHHHRFVTPALPPAPNDLKGHICTEPRDHGTGKSTELLTKCKHHFNKL